MNRAENEAAEAIASAKGPRPVQQFVILMMDDGNINVNGPLHDKLLCFGLLKCAEMIVASYVPKEKPRVEVISGVAGVDLKKGPRENGLV